MWLMKGYRFIDAVSNNQRMREEKPCIADAYSFRMVNFNGALTVY